ncbi:hypothetical protein [Pedobacter miscanthi]|uniref:hypothetical protein n=1 Tax=Pedobacter miscanthi TaxID=2259170 RepID=UPI00293023BC|nr:hypothetical protein [Pedobacter miscanthi]
MALNTIKINLGSIILVILIACNARTENRKDKASNQDTCKYYRYDAHQIVSNLGCQNCHVPYGDRMDKNIFTFREISVMDSLKLINYAFKKKHKGWYSTIGTFKASRMDTLSDCEIKSVIRYIKDSGRDIATPSQ